MAANLTSIPKLLVTALRTLGAVLPQHATNGASKWGTLEAPTFDEFITTDNTPVSLSDGVPWGKLTAEHDNPYTSQPRTGMTRRYEWDIERAILAPDGVDKEMIVVNGAFPGPTIEANWGDWIEVKVNNKLDEGTSVHWHGMLQKETPWSDGVPSVMQCPIAPNSTFTYRFRASLYGTSWWHSHYSAQYAAGMFGPMIIHGPSHLIKSQKEDIDLGPVLISDWYHREYFDIVEDVMSTDLQTVIGAGVSNNNLINGKMAFDCNNVTTGAPCKEGAGISKFRFRPGKKHRLRLINAGSEGWQRFSIDEHEMTVISHDFVAVKPYKVKDLALGIGQRADVIVTAKPASTPRKSYFMRSHILTSCTPSLQPDALAAIFYPGADEEAVPDSIPQEYTIIDDAETGCPQNTNKPLQETRPIFPIPASKPDFEREIEITFGQNETGHWLWMMNGVSFRANFNNPILLLANKGNFSYPENWNVINTGNKKTVRVIVKNNTPAAHPMHFHGHNMQEILSLPPGALSTWDGKIPDVRFPSRRDTHVVHGNSVFVFQYNTDNPGVWPFHCHIAWHISGGLYVNLMERTNFIRANMIIPQVMHQTCRNWWKYTGSNIVEQIDSGL